MSSEGGSDSSSAAGGAVSGNSRRVVGSPPATASQTPVTAPASTRAMAEDRTRVSDFGSEHPQKRAAGAVHC